ncbi:MAG: hypothetical protein EA369_03355 [Bradymonadales bacterium]|nr:MAG: hypothetical protein EA369_03355 [Bradymonadales bacterium]
MKKLQLVLTLFFLAPLVVACASKHAAQTDQSTVEALMIESEFRIQNCYRDFQERFPSVDGGSLRLRADYLPNGEFGSVRSIESFAGSGPLVHCLSRIVESWRASPPFSRGPVDLHFEYTRRSSISMKGLEEGDIEKVMDARSSDFKECYDWARDQVSEMETGDLRLQFEVLSSGEVGRVRELAGFKGSEMLLFCLEPRARRWTFPASEVSTLVNWTWTFAESSD